MQEIIDLGKSTFLDVPDIGFTIVFQTPFFKALEFPLKAGGKMWAPSLDRAFQ